MTEELQDAIGHYTGARFTVAVNSGTDALFTILRAVGTCPGDEIIVPAIAASSSVSAVCHTGARPVVVDVRPNLYTIDPDAVRARYRPDKGHPAGTPLRADGGHGAVADDSRRSGNRAG